MLVLGLLVLAAAVVVGATGVASNTGSAHQLPGGFNIFGYHVHGSAGKLFFAGLIIGAIAMVGLAMVADGLRRNARLRRELFRFRREARSRRQTPAAPAAPVAPAAKAAPTVPAASASPVPATSSGNGNGSASARSERRRGLRGLAGLRPAKPASGP